MSVNGQTVELSAGDRLRERLDDPAVAASLNSLLDHADLIALMVQSLSEFIGRGNEITETLATGISEIRAATANSALSEVAAEFKTVDTMALASSMAALAAAMAQAGPSISTVLTSPLLAPESVEVVGQVGEALIAGKAAATAQPGGPKGVFSLMKVLKDKDVNRGLGFLIHVAKAFGKSLPA